MSLSVLDDFAKWLFVASAIVGTLGGGFGLVKADDLSGLGRLSFALAVFAVGISLALAAFARMPRKINVNRYSIPSMTEGIRGLVLFRGRILLAATTLFAAGLILAGLAPLLP